MDLPSVPQVENRKERHYRSDSDLPIRSDQSALTKRSGTVPALAGDEKDIPSAEEPFDPYAFAEAWYEAHPESLKRYSEAIEQEMKGRNYK